MPHRRILLVDDSPVFLEAANRYLSSLPGIEVVGQAFSGQSMTLTLPLTMQPGYSGAKNIYLFAKDAAGKVTGWVQLGTWSVPTH